MFIHLLNDQIIRVRVLEKTSEVNFIDKEYDSKLIRFFPMAVYLYNDIHETEKGGNVKILFMYDKIGNILEEFRKVYQNLKNKNDLIQCDMFIKREADKHFDPLLIKYKIQVLYQLNHELNVELPSKEQIEKTLEEYIQHMEKFLSETRKIRGKRYSE